MTVEKQLRDSLFKYPSIYKNKWDVYHHWFIVNGNGYEWNNGELTTYPDQTLITTVDEAIELQDKYLAEKLGNLKEGSWEIEFYKDNHKEYVALIKDIDNRMNDFTPNRKEIYPMCQYSDILHIPSDIKPDWQFAVMDMYNWLMDNYDSLGKDNQKYINSIKL